MNGMLIESLMSKVAIKTLLLIILPYYKDLL